MPFLIDFIDALWNQALPDVKDNLVVLIWKLVFAIVRFDALPQFDQALAKAR